MRYKLTTVDCMQILSRYCTVPNCLFNYICFNKTIDFTPIQDNTYLLNNNNTLGNLFYIRL